MLGRGFLCEIRSMDTTDAVEDVHKRLLKVLKDEFERQTPSTHSLCQCSVLCGAFCRRLATLDASGVKDAVKYVELLRLELSSRLSPVQEASFFAYALGEIEAFSTMRRVRYRQRLDALTKSVPASRWDVEKITDVMQELSASDWRPEAVRGYHEVVKRPREVGEGGSDGVPMPVRWRLPLRDPISLLVIAVPARGSLCRHKEVFDMVAFVRATQQAVLRRRECVEETANPRWGSGGDEDLPALACPVCGRAAPLHSVRVDEPILEAMRQHAARGGTLSSDDCVVWDDSRSAYDVVEAPAAARVAGERLEEAPEREPNRPLRVVQIEGHVLYAEE
ncbi:uncharacterized protein Tco025E_06561 [Trypanosoma conorhini]|uniref:Uncharacterized protein n=1 Tax=Trypanosoma conorhini TaxID=83891 RepID=A0A422P463_9TRYP|nr:uncharacterized protein Tco025E_06561 [Trypanosoma conorhini]RNF12492.1 hypothetical protein Tco025E_06561 [Trypanosoma conorhini]